MAKKKKPLTLPEAFEAAKPRPAQGADRSQKKNYAERLSRELAQSFADHLRSSFEGILPTPEGEGQESKARTSKGYKKLDVNYSTLELGLALGVSIKTINFPDRGSARFTKNYSRNENELRAEAIDYHKRQPWAVMVAIIFLPVESASDANPKAKAEQGASSFGSAVRFFRNISGRTLPSGESDIFERVFIGLYDKSGETRFFDVEKAPPKTRPPREDELLSHGEVIAAIRATYDLRNSPPFEWADDDEPAVGPLELEDDPE